MTGNFELRRPTSDDARELWTLIAGAFLDDLDEEALELYRMVDEPNRAQVVSDDGRLVGSGAIQTRELTVPGAVIPAAHVTAVAVASTHRRQGLLTRIMHAQFGEIRERGTEPIAVLWASEGSIYGRFGYGRASWQVKYKIAVREAGPPEAQGSGRLRQAVPADVRDELAAVYDRVRVRRPGMSGRPGRWWEYLTADPKQGRRGMSAERAVLFERDGVPRGYARWRTKGGWGANGPSGEVSVTEVVAEDAEAYAALWRFVLSIDLVREVRYSFASVDEPLAHLVGNSQGLAPSVEPGLWVRLVDVPGALSARRYAAPIDMVLEVTDTRIPENAGRWRLIGDAVSAKCERSDADPDLSLDVRELGAVYLGGTSLSTLVGAGLVTEESPGAVDRASVAFGWHRQPVSIEVF